MGEGWFEMVEVTPFMLVFYQNKKFVEINLLSFAVGFSWVQNWVSWIAPVLSRKPTS